MLLPSLLFTPERLGLLVRREPQEPQDQTEPLEPQDQTERPELLDLLEPQDQTERRGQVEPLILLVDQMVISILKRTPIKFGRRPVGLGP